MNGHEPHGAAEHDPLGCFRQLHEILARPELDAFNSNQPISPESRRAALWLAVALGRCRLFGVDPAEHNGILPPKIAVAAAEECSLQLRQLNEGLRNLVQQWDAGLIDGDCELEAGHVLFIRMDLWAAVVAIDEAYQACIRAKDNACGMLRSAVTGMVVESQALDDVMQANLDALATASETSLLENWRSLLVSPYVEALPWWLDGTLETAAKQVEEKSIASQPSEVAWRQLVSKMVTEPESSKPRAMPVLRPLQETLNDLAEAFRRRFPETMLATAAASGEKTKAKVLWDSKEGLAPVRCIVYQEPNGDLRLDFTSTEDTHENQTFEVVVKVQRQPTVTFRRDPLTGQLFGETRIPRDELPEGGLSKLTFLLKKA